MKTLVEGRTEHGLDLIAKLARVGSDVVVVISFLIDPFLNQGEVIGMTDFLKHLKILFAVILDRVLPKMGQQHDRRLGVLWHRVDMNHGHNSRRRILRGDGLKR